MGRRLASRIKGAAETLTVFLADLVAVLAVLRLAVFLRASVLPFFYEGFPEQIPSYGLRELWWIFLVWIFFFYYEGLYTKRYSFWDEVGALWKVAFFSTVSVFTILSIGKMGEEMSRTVIVLMGLLAVLLFPFTRIFSKKLLRKTGLLRRRVLILGAGETGRLILKALRKEPNYGYEVLGFLDDDHLKCGELIEGIKVHRGVDQAATYIKRCNIEDIFIAMPGAGKDRLQGLINTLQHKVDRLLFVPDIFGIAVLGTNLQHFFHEEAFALEMKNNLSNPINMAVKRCFDLVLCAVFLPVLALPMAMMALLIRVDSRGRAIFSQERVGRRGANFRCLKFRTMHEDAEQRLNRLLEADPEARAKWETHRKLDNDPRVTRVGRFLRVTSLDELPQIFNVLKGEMSLVGPRPVMQEEIDKHYREHAALCFSVLPGITGLWQVSGRSDTGYAYRISLDSWYVRNWNLWLDIVILLKTVRIVVKREGAY